ncbi:rhodanese-like domain-containing protein [Blastococcus sp. CT_GayMR16]|uniref:rhodanese-like domain-containing protein n=1 Tax=Blastococcus sp. CT_GayMR16 TaxID=2559607 RepID=UPI00107461A6|nr:rhodanese-like domain-containing protein [Blastococcus sp. CT_GayMR16]TFV91101.1 rhodanese-like domain-containing protein [Blastococcus sp. CT_GayMR16]
MPTVGEFELTEMVEQGALVIDGHTRGSFWGRTIPRSVHIPHDQIIDRRDELDPGRVSVVLCNDPQCPQSPNAIRGLLGAGYPAQGLAYHRGGMHDRLTPAMPTEARED